VESTAKLAPPPTKGHLSVARLSAYWYVACRSRDLAGKPLARTVLGQPLVLFRDAAGSPAALLDRCPHRNVELSLGGVEDGLLECRYHGWRFAGDGSCRLVPGLCDSAQVRGRSATSFATRERDGFVWVWGEADSPPTNEPQPLTTTEENGYATIVRELDFPGTLHATAENALDVPHTAFLHRGLFRGSGWRKHIRAAVRRAAARVEAAVAGERVLAGDPVLRAVVRRAADRVEAEYIGEPRPEGLVGRMLAPQGGVVEHWDRFVLPSLAQVEYRLGPENHLVVTSLCTPIDDFTTRMYAVVAFRLRFPSALVRAVVTPIAMRILRQDAAILRSQSATIQRFGGEQFESTEIDLLGPHIWRLLRQAESGPPPERSEDLTVVREVELDV